MLENPLFLILILTGVTFLVTGFILFKFPPKKINSLYGYRTASSMISQESWDFSQTYSAKQMMYMGGILVVLSALSLTVRFGVDFTVLIGLGLVVLGAVWLFLRIERELKSRFKNG